MKVRKRPVVVDAIRWDGREETIDAIVEMAPDESVSLIGKALSIKTLEGTMTASLGDWVIRGVNGELYPCKPDIFEKTYEIVPPKSGEADT